MRIFKTLIFIAAILIILLGAYGVAQEYYDLNLEIKPRFTNNQTGVEPSPQPRTDSWLDIGTEHSRITGDVIEPGRLIRVYNQVNGRIEGKVVRVTDNSLVTGPITADAVAVMGGTVRNNIQAASIFVGSDTDYENDNRRGYHPVSAEDKGIVFGDLIGNDIRIANSAEVYGKIGLNEGQVDISGQVNGPVIGRKIILRSTAIINGDVVATGGVITLEPGAALNGRLTDGDGKSVQVIQGWVSKTKDKNQYAAVEPVPPPTRSNPEIQYVEQRSSMSILWIPVLLGLVSLVVMVYIFLANEAHDAVENIRIRPWRSLWIGFLTLLLSFPLGFLLAVTILGIPLAFALAIGVAAATVVGLCASSLIVGQKLSPYLGDRGKSLLISVVIGTVLIAHLVWVPILGWGILAIVTLMGLGAVTINWYPRLKDGWRKWRAKRKQQQQPEIEPTPDQTESPE